MGVLSCNRLGCERIMCDTYINSIGYVCNECKEEYKEYLNKMNLTPKSEGEIKHELEKFMDTRKGIYAQGDEMSVDEFFDSYDKD